MKSREFNQHLNSCRVRGKLVAKKLRELPNEIRTAMVHFIVRSRGPVVVDLIPDGFDMPWLQCMGYLSRTKGAAFTFIHTSAHTIK